MLNAGHTSNPLVGEHRDSELAIRDAGVPVTLLRNGLYLERYTDHLSEYLQAGEHAGAASCDSYRSRWGRFKPAGWSQAILTTGATTATRGT
jgi:hypothetical protein